MTLREDQIIRYSRHVLLPDVGGAGQERLLAAAVEVEVGPGRAAELCALAYLAAAGVGRLVLAGEPEGPVTAGEARAGVLLGAADAGTPRLAAIRRRVRALNPDVDVVAARGAPGAAARRLAAVPAAAPDPDHPVEALFAGAAAAAATLAEIARR